MKSEAGKTTGLRTCSSCPYLATYLVFQTSHKLWEPEFGFEAYRCQVSAHSQPACKMDGITRGCVPAEAVPSSDNSFEWLCTSFKSLPWFQVPLASQPFTGSQRAGCPQLLLYCSKSIPGY